MKYENEILNIQRLVEEKIELSFYEKRNDGTNQFLVISMNGQEVPAEDVILISLKSNLETMMITGNAGALVYDQMDLSNYLGKLEVFCCKKKKGILGKDSLKVIASAKRTYHRTGLENGEEKPISLCELMQ